MNPIGPIRARELPPGLPVSSSVSGHFSWEPQPCLGFLELPKFSKLASTKKGPSGRCCPDPTDQSPTQPRLQGPEGAQPGPYRPLLASKSGHKRCQAKETAGQEAGVAAEEGS